MSNEAVTAYLTLGITFLVLAVLFIVLWPQANTPIKASPISTKFEVYFLTLGGSGNLVAYLPNHTGTVSVKFDNNIVIPYVEVPVMQEKQVLTGKREEFVAWGYGGILYVKNREQLESLLLR